MSAVKPRRHGLVLAGAGLAALAGGAAWRWWQLEGGTRPDADVAEAFWRLSLPTPTGAQMPFAPLRGRPLVVNFWATWCPPCVKEMPELDRFARTHAGRGWQVVGIAIDQLAPVQQFLSKSPVGFPIVLAEPGVGLDWVRRLGNPAGGLPFTVQFDAGGGLARRRLGPTTHDELAKWSE